MPLSAPHRAYANRKGCIQVPLLAFRGRRLRIGACPLLAHFPDVDLLACDHFRRTLRRGVVTPGTSDRLSAVPALTCLNL
jgi:hypothetical protein